MKYQINSERLLNYLEKIINVPSPVGYYRELNPVLAEMAKELHQELTIDQKGTAYITLEGEDNSKTVQIAAHADTLGLMVRSVTADGMLLIRRLGGGGLTSLEGENVVIHTRKGKKYTGYVICKSHSTHVFDDAATLERNENTLRVLLDEDVSCEKDVRELGILNGDFISVEPRFRKTEQGYVRSRYIDDKGAIACCFEALSYLKEQGKKPRYRTIFSFPYYEEVSLGGTYIPEGVSEMIAVDIGLIGPELCGHERAVSICAKDASAPYDIELTDRLIALAEKAECDYAVDCFYRYGTDARAALRAGHNLKAAVFGMAVYCSHGMERTHILGLENTTGLLIAYLTEEI